MNEKIKKAFDNLIGCQIIDITENSITVRKRDELYELIGYEDTYDISFDKYDGDCCGYAEITKELFFEPNNENNPVITNWTASEEENDSSQVVTLTLFGMKKPLVKYEFECSSGSGWCYGATIQVNCRDANETLCSW